jgi:hypothetical protein
MAGGYNAPNVQNLLIPKGFLQFKLDGLSTFVHLGNATKIIYRPNVPVADHFTEMAGTKLQDFSTIIQKGGQLEAQLEEFTAYNLSLFFLGAVAGTAAAPSISLFSSPTQFQGELQLVATNDIGPRWFLDLTRVLIAPTGELERIGDTYANMPLTFKHIVDDNLLFGTTSLLPDNASILPVNWFQPFIVNNQDLGNPTPRAHAGDVLTVYIGAWTGPEGYTYQWLANGHAIPGATGKNWTVLSSYHSEIITADVIGTNTLGSTTVLTSNQTLPVHF